MTSVPPAVMAPAAPTASQSSIIGVQPARPTDRGPFGLRLSVATSTILRRYNGLASSLQLEMLFSATAPYFDRIQDHWQVGIEFVRYLMLLEEMDPASVQQISMLPPPAVLAFWFVLRHDDDDKAYAQFCRMHNFTRRAFPQKGFSQPIEAGNISAFLSAFGQLERYFLPALSGDDPTSGYSKVIWDAKSPYKPFGNKITL